MTPANLVRRPLPPRGPVTFAALTAFYLDREREPRPLPRSKPRCVALQDDGSQCGLPASHIDFNRGGHVCFAHRPDRKKEVLCLT